MKRFTKSLLVVSMLVGMAIPSWGQATPSTEGKDFWVTFLRAGYKDGSSGQVVDTGDPTKLTLTISARKQCIVTIENTSTGLSQRLNVSPGNTSVPMIGNKTACYSYQSEQVTNTALHVTSTEDISLFAGNYRDKSFDAANIYPTTALLDDYIVQTYPPSAHADQPQGTHFAIVATEDNTIVDYTLTAKTVGGNTGSQTTPTLNKGQVYYVWTGRKEGDAADLSGTTVKARNGKKIAVFQGSSHTNLPYKMRDRDHIFSQAMPTAYWGSEFGITSSMNHRRDIIAVMAINDGTEVYYNNSDGDKILLHTFNFAVDKKHYWTFEIGDEEAYSTHSSSPYTGKLPEPDIADSSCYLTTSCPVGVHLFMVSNTYDEPTSTAGSIGDPAMLWISPIEQVIKEISFSTYADGTDIHYMNILTTTADVPNVIWTDETNTKRSLTSYFHPLSGNADYSYARVEINNGSHNLKGNVGFLAHVYGFGERCSYAYSCGSSTVQRSVTFNGTPLMIDSTYDGKFCVNEPIEMKLNIGNNEYESIEWLFGDGTSYVPDPSTPNDQKKQVTHTYTTPGWYDLTVSAVYVNSCTHTRYNEDMRFSFRVVRPDTVIGEVKMDTCISLESYKEKPAYWDELIANGKIDTVQDNCYDDVVLNMITYRRETEETKDTLRGWDVVYGYNDRPYYISTDVVDEDINSYGCTHYIRYYVDVIQCLDMSFSSDALSLCPGENVLVAYTKSKGDIKDEQGRFVVPGLIDTIISIPNYNTQIGELTLPTKDLKTPGYYTGTLTVEDKNCDTKQYQINLVVNYPSDIFQFKFNNVLAVYQNKGYQFTTYQWYVNGMPVDGATSSILYLGQNVTFKEGDIVFVMLTDKNGMTLPSCPQILSDIDPDMDNDALNQVPARKMLINSQFVIRKGDTDYDIYGQKVR